jgi:hypothetical protein
MLFRRVAARRRVLVRAARWVRDERWGGRLGPVVERRVPLAFGAAVQAVVGVRCAALLDAGHVRGAARGGVAVPGGWVVLDGPVQCFEPAPGRPGWASAVALGRLEGPAARRGPLRRSIAIELGVEPWDRNTSSLLLRLVASPARVGFTPAVVELLDALDEALVATSVELALGRLSLLDDAVR